ncbi:hypothetical protein [uncultured Paludibaculum sp.]|uniref:hypothetical protein n=1 Tax=uncultured Paludibaculum sp. TaxID=1765020 RepID=UPI002AAA6980|nr:hypothetical protein [uncultured Paludibaculum sp.]
MTTLLLWLAARLVPSERRREWLAEWHSELWYITTSRARFCLGAFPDACWVRAHSPRPRLRLQTPAQCLAFLFGLTFVALAIYLPTPHRPVRWIDACIPLIALIFVPVSTILVDTSSPARTNRGRSLLFLLLKFALLLPIVYCFSFGLAPLLSASGLQAHAGMVGYAVAFRWAFKDQRRRCPVCLRLLSNPASVGQPASTLLDWYGTEFLCAQGHGFMQVPEITTSYRPQRWLDPDPAWSGLFNSHL